MKLNRLPFAILPTLLLASPALAEVADKETSSGILWVWAIAFNVVAVILQWLRPPLGLLVVPFAAFDAWAWHMEVSDPYVRTAILVELGPDYVTSSYAAAGAGLFGPLIIVLVHSIICRRKRNGAQSAASEGRRPPR